MSKNVTSDLAAEVETAGGNYPVWVGWASLVILGKELKNIYLHHAFILLQMKVF